MSAFYHATRMQSADYAVARCLSVRPSVCLSYAGVVSKRLYISSTFFPTILVFPHQTGWTYSDGTPLTGVSNERGYKNHDFRPISRFISDLMQDRAIVTLEGE